MLAGDALGELWLFEDDTWSPYADLGFNAIIDISGSSLQDLYVLDYSNLTYFDASGPTSLDLGLGFSAPTHVGHRPGAPGSVIAVGYSGMVLVREPE